MQNSAIVMVPPRAAIRAEYRTGAHYLDKDAATREANGYDRCRSHWKCERLPQQAGARRRAAGQSRHPRHLPTPRGVRVYLKEFLSDPRVIEDQGLIWKLILNGVILRIRPARKARDYPRSGIPKRTSRR